MASLEARYHNPDTGQITTVAREVPLGRLFSLGKRPLSDPDVPSWNRSEWVTPPDRHVHGRHAELYWDGEALKVVERQAPQRVLNPIRYAGRAKPEFLLKPGETFRIGDTWFTLRGDAIPQALDTDSDINLPIEIAAFAPGELRQLPYSDGSALLCSIEAICELIHFTHDPDQLDGLLLDKLLSALPTAEAAAVVAIDQTTSDGRIAIRCARQLTQSPFRPSRTLVCRAVRDELRNMLFAQAQSGADLAEATAGVGMDWAICAPMSVEVGSLVRGLYVTGRATDSDALRDYQKFIDFACQMYQATFHRRRAEGLITRMEAYLPRQLRMVLERTDPEHPLSRREATVTVLFCDVRGFSRFAENEGQLLGKWEQISRALDVMTTAIEHEEGVIGDLQGDAAMGFWGWPEEQTDQVRRAARAALYIRQEFAKKDHFRHCNFHCGIGVAQGKAIVGSLGTAAQRKLDVFGPVVNLASRLEGLTKVFGVSILIDDGVAEVLKGDSGPLNSATRRLARVLPAGSSRAATIHELLPIEEYGSSCRKHWEAAVRNFMDMRNWEVARMNLERYLRYRGLAGGSADPSVAVLMEHMRRHGFQAPSDWDGVIRFEGK